MVQCYEFNYTSNQPQPLPDVWVPCPIGDNCCIGADVCLSNNICHPVSSSKEKREASYSSYYNARCTDPTYTNPACDKICIDSPPDIVYNYTSNLWACCGNNTAGEVTCNDPLNEYYEAPAPDRLATLSSGAVAATTATLTPYTAATASSTNATSSVTSTHTPGQATTSSPTSANSTSSSLSTGAKAGAGVGVALAVLAFLVAILFWTRKSKARRRSPGNPAWKGQEIGESAEKKPVIEMPVHERSRQELDTGESGLAAELNDDVRRSYDRVQDVPMRRYELSDSK